jgi:hypothetical protein
MSATLEANIIKQLHRLDDQRQAEVLDFVEYLATKSRVASSTADWPPINPSVDLSQYVGAVPGIPEDGVAYQRQIRDAEWP